MNEMNERNRGTKNIKFQGEKYKKCIYVNIHLILAVANFDFPRIGINKHKHQSINICKVYV
jgi:hypothetical protein